MMVRSLALTLGFLGLCVVGGWAAPLLATPHTPPAPRKVSHVSRATSRPAVRTAPSGEVKAPAAHPKSKKEDCETGCGSHGHIPHPTQAQTLLWLRSFATAPLKAGNQSLESLLFHHAHTLNVLHKNKPKLPLKAGSFLRRELQRKEAWVSVRIRTQGHPTYVEVKPHKVILSEHFHLHAETAVKIQAPSFGGRVERVGLNRLWIRI
ncbi:MAG: hypothetical protein EP343_22725 [Deltaproteobacteria bacterium]|nr:MAG: hypothetical protein EP343_22725 [Deltaproteobacteria bacterium]